MGVDEPKMGKNKDGHRNNNDDDDEEDDTNNSPALFTMSRTSRSGALPTVSTMNNNNNNNNKAKTSSGLNYNDDDVDDLGMVFLRLTNNYQLTNI